VQVWTGQSVRIYSATHPSVGFHMEAVKSTLSAQTAGKHTGRSERMLTPGEPVETPDRGEKLPRSRVSLDVSPCILHPPPALRPIVSASLCPLGWEERRGEGMKEQGGKALPLLTALANHSAALPGAAAARCLRTDYAAFIGCRNYYFFETANKSRRNL